MRAEWFKGLHAGNGGRFYRGARGTGAGCGSGLGALGRGIYLTWDEGMAEWFAERSGGTVYTYEIDAGLNLLDSKSAVMAEIKAIYGLALHEYCDHPGYSDAITREVKARGYEGVISDNVAEGLVIFDASQARLLEGGEGA